MAQTFDEAVERLGFACREFLKEECACPVPPGVSCYTCSWKVNVLMLAKEVMEWDGKVR